MSWPKRIFLDTTVLYKLGSRPETNVDLAKLLELARIFKIEVSIPIIAWKEYLRHRRKELESARSHLAAAIRELEKYADDLSSYALLADEINKLDENLEARFKDKADEIGLTLVALPLLNVEELAEMSLANKAPFQDSDEKGFRDALIMFTVLEEIRGKADQQAIFVTEDKRLRTGCESFVDKFKTALSVVSSLDDARLLVENHVAKIGWEALRVESEEAIKVLSMFQTNLAKEVEKTEYLSGGFFLVDEPDRTKIETVKSVRFVKLTSALWKDRESSSPKILFKVECSAEVVLRDPPSTRTYLVGEPKQQFGFRGLKGALLNVGRVQTKSIPLMLFGDAELIRENERYALKQIRVSPPDIDEMIRLMLLERSEPPPP
jgi:predicted nucleic acid-binding protein